MVGLSSADNISDNWQAFSMIGIICSIIWKVSGLGIMDLNLASVLSTSSYFSSLRLSKAGLNWWIDLNKNKVEFHRVSTLVMTFLYSHSTGFESL